MVLSVLPLRYSSGEKETWYKEVFVSFLYRCSSSSSEAGSSQQESRSRKLSVDSTPDSLSSCREMSPCSSFSTRKENHPNVCGSRGDPDSKRSTVDFVDSSKVDSVRVSLTRSLSLSEQRSREGPPDGSFSLYNKDSVCSSDSYSQESLVPDSRTSSDKSSTPVASTTGSPSSSTTNLHEDLKETQSAETKSSNGVLQTSITPTWRGSRKFSAPANRLTRQLSAGGEGSSTGVQHSQNYYPFPSRKTPRISEAAKRLGMYSSFWETLKSSSPSACWGTTYWVTVVIFFSQNIKNFMSLSTQLYFCLLCVLMKTRENARTRAASYNSFVSRVNYSL